MEVAVELLMPDVVGRTHFPKATREELLEVPGAWTGMCMEQLSCWRCTRPRGHGGQHVAIDERQEVVCARWWSGTVIIHEEEDLWP